MQTTVMSPPALRIRRAAHLGRWMKGGLPGTRTLTLIATTQGVHMGMSDKATNKLDELKGKGYQVVYDRDGYIVLHHP